MKAKLTSILFLLSTIIFAQTPELTIQLGHSKLIYDVAYSPNGKFIASASADRTVKIWETDKGRELRTIYIDEGYVTSVQFSPDSKHLLFSGGDYEIGILKIYSLSENKIISNLQGHKEYAWKSRYSPDGSKIISISFDQRIKIWNSKTGALLHTSKEQPALLRGLAVDPKGEWFVNTNDDGAVKIWSLETYEEIFELDLPELFEARCVTVAPNGAYVLVGGYGGDIAVFQRDQFSDGPTYLNEAHNNTIDDIAVTNDNQFFLTAAHDNLIKKWDLKSGAQTSYFKGHKDWVYALDVHPNKPQFISGGSFDKSLMEWSINKNLLIKKYTGNVYPVKNLHLSEDGRKLYINSFDKYGGDIYLWNLNRYDKVQNIAPLESKFQFMDFQNSYAAFGTEQGDIKIFETSKDELKYDFSLQNRLSSLSLYPNQEKAIVGLFDKSKPNGGQRTLLKLMDFNENMLYNISDPDSANSYEASLHFSISDSSYYQVLSNWESISINKFDIKDHTLINSIIDSSLLFPNYKIDPSGKYIVIGKNNKIVVYDSKTGNVIYSNERIGKGELNDIAFIEENQLLVVGGEWSSGYLKLIDLKQQQVIKSIDSYTKSINAVTINNERNLLLIGSEDGKVRLLNKDSWEEVVTLINFSDEQNSWAAIHPTGLFDGSESAIEQHLYFTYNLEPIELFQLKERYYEPGMVQKVLGFNEEPIRDVNKLKSIHLYPKAHLELLDKANLQVKIENRNGGIGTISFYINGKEVLEDISGRLQNNEIIIDLSKYTKYLPANQMASLEIVTTNASKSLRSPNYTISYTPKPKSGFGNSIERPRLYALIVGTSNYRGDQLDLNYAAKDAEDMASALKLGGSKLFGKQYVNIHLLTTNQIETLQPNKQNINRSIQEIASKIGPNDILLLYFSGHGVNYNDGTSKFYYLTKDVATGDLKDQEIRNQYTISTDDITQWLKSIPAQKQVLILDACNSGEAVDDLLSLSKNVSSEQIKAFDRMKDRTGLFIITGSAANKASYEASKYGQSLLTYSLLNGLNIVSEKNDHNLVDLIQWLTHSKEKVPELASSIGGVQQPIVVSPRNLNSFDIALIPDEEKIQLASIKPIFIRTTLLNLEEQDDVLNLSESLDQYFKGQSAKGKNAAVIFIDVNKFPTAYSLKGFYSIDNDQVKVSASIRKGKEKIGKIEVIGLTSNTAQIIKDIIKEIDKAIK